MGKGPQDYGDVRDRGVEAANRSGISAHADYAPGLENHVRGNVQARVRRGRVNVPQDNVLAVYPTHQPQIN